MKRVYIFLIPIIGIVFVGCSKKMPIAVPGGGSSGVTIPSENIASANEEISGNIGGGDSEPQPTQYTQTNNRNSFQPGKVSPNGKYLGSDGVSKSGIKMLYFATDSYTLDEDQVQRLMSDLPKIKRLTSQGKIIVEGNCDEFGTDEYNHALGLKRAKAVKKLLINAGIEPQKIETVSYGESNPVCTIDAPACHAKNRRAEINKI